MYAGYLDLSHPLVWTIADVLDPTECARFIGRMRNAEDATVAPIVGHDGEEIDLEVRNNTRIMFDDIDLAGTLWPRVRGSIPPALMGLTVAGLNERFRVYRYAEQQHHGSHWDTSIELPDGRTSLLTFMIYLNDDFEGGETSFDEIDEIVIPRQGHAVVFQHRVVHTARPVMRGEKFALRSEVFYRHKLGA